MPIEVFLKKQQILQLNILFLFPLLYWLVHQAVNHELPKHLPE
jgi:hypothetical protein